MRCVHGAAIARTLDIAVARGAVGVVALLEVVVVRKAVAVRIVALRAIGLERRAQRRDVVRAQAARAEEGAEWRGDRPQAARRIGMTEEARG